MKLRILFTLFTLCYIIQFEALAQKGVIATYRTEKVYISFIHIKSGKMLKDPVVMGRDVKIQHNISYDKIALSYTSTEDGNPHHMILSYVRNEADGNKGVIMEDENGNPATVYNELQANGSLTVFTHGINKEGYVTTISLENARKIY